MVLNLTLCEACLGITLWKYV